MKKNVSAVSEAGIKEGKLLSWGYERVFTPTGTGEEHDLIGLYGYENWEQLEPAGAPSDAVKAAMKALGFASPQDYADKRDPLRDIVRSEIWHRAAGTTRTADTVPKVGEYIVVSYLKPLPGKAADYLDIWKKYSLPLQEERVKTGKLKSYSMWTVGGGGTASNYDMVSLARYPSFKDITPGDAAGAQADSVADHIHAGKDWRQMRRDMISMRTIYRSEIVRIQYRTP